MSRQEELMNISSNPLPTLEAFRKLCYDMKYVIENELVAEIIDKNHAPLERSVDEMLDVLADWAEATTEDYNDATERRG